MSYYDVLGISSGATEDDVRKAYKRLSLKYHPDRNLEEAGRFQEINEAYEILSDKEKRWEYDKDLASETTDKPIKHLENIVESFMKKNLGGGYGL